MSRHQHQWTDGPWEFVAENGSIRKFSASLMKEEADPGCLYLVNLAIVREILRLAERVKSLENSEKTLQEENRRLRDQDETYGMGAESAALREDNQVLKARGEKLLNEQGFGDRLATLEHSEISLKTQVAALEEENASLRRQAGALEERCAVILGQRDEWIERTLERKAENAKLRELNATQAGVLRLRAEDEPRCVCSHPERCHSVGFSNCGLCPCERYAEDHTGALPTFDASVPDLSGLSARQIWEQLTREQRIGIWRAYLPEMLAATSVTDIVLAMTPAQRSILGLPG